MAVPKKIITRQVFDTPKDFSSNKTPDLCKCDITLNCDCAKSNKIPAIELRFVYLLRVHGIGKIGGVDVVYPF